MEGNLYIEYNLTTLHSYYNFTSGNDMEQPIATLQLAGDIMKQSMYSMSITAAQHYVGLQLIIRILSGLMSAMLEFINVLQVPKTFSP